MDFSKKIERVCFRILSPVRIVSGTASRVAPYVQMATFRIHDLFTVHPHIMCVRDIPVYTSTHQFFACVRALLSVVTGDHMISSCPTFLKLFWTIQSRKFSKYRDPRGSRLAKLPSTGWFSDYRQW